jgi:uncharacterized membrane protein
MEVKQLYDPSTIDVLRRTLDEVVCDERVVRRKLASPLEIAQHILAEAARGERDMKRLKASAFAKLGIAMH